MCDGELHPWNWDQSPACGCHVLPHFVFICRFWEFAWHPDCCFQPTLRVLRLYEPCIACLSALKVMWELLACVAFLEHIQRSVSYELMCSDEIPVAGSWEGSALILDENKSISTCDQTREQWHFSETWHCILGICVLQDFYGSIFNLYFSTMQFN